VHVRPGWAYLLGSDWLLRGLVQLLNSLGIISEVLLASNEDDGKTLAEMQDFGNPLLWENMVSKSLR